MTVARILPPGQSAEQLSIGHQQIPASNDGDFLYDFDILPPAHYWLKDPTDKIDTPLDERGVVDIDRLIKQVRRYIHPDYRWRGRSDIHHVNWPHATYADLQADGMPTMTYRELPTKKVRLPRTFYNVLHIVTNIPPVPDVEVMNYQIEAWKVARNLFHSVKDATVIKRKYQQRLNRLGIELDDATEMDEIGKQITDCMAERHFRGVERHLEALQTVPEEHWPFQAHERPEAVIGQVGLMAMKGYQVRTKKLYLGTVA